MPKRNDIESILIIGAGPIVIGQACEFDYSGVQACKALKEEGYRIILVNSNPATIMTDPDIADATYIEPITAHFLEKIIAKERPDALLPTLGGQTALNCTLELNQTGVLKKYQVELIGASIKTIELAENRELFHELMNNIGLEVPHTQKIHSLPDAKTAMKSMNFPVIIRPSFTLGGSGASMAPDASAFMECCEKAFTASPLQEIMVDEALMGWKEFELEVIRDKNDNCIIVCGVENIDPLGIHTGDSITVTPIQTLTDKEYQTMRQAAFKVIKAVGVETGGSNVQFAVHPKTGKMVVIEMNPRVSRSSALASKASGFPIAKIAAKLAIGYTLDELKNDITGDQLPASFEPSLDYVVVKMPRFDTQKFLGHPAVLGPQMQSVGEVMAIGRTFEEALQKAMRSLETETCELSKLYSTLDQADPWFLKKIQSLIQSETLLSTQTIRQIPPSCLKRYKKSGFSDHRLASLLNAPEKEIFELRKKWKIQPTYKRIDSCAGEFETTTAYLYGTYEQTCEAHCSKRPKMLVIGSGPNRIGQGIEFDYCCVQAIIALKEAGYETIMLNCNPETVSTDYDVADRLYCTPLTLEDVLDIIRIEKPTGVFVQYGGQTPLKLAEGLANAQIPLCGLSMEAINQTENRQQFQQLLHALNLKQPKNQAVYHVDEGMLAAKDLKFPIMIRPSFVIGGTAMKVANNPQELAVFLESAFALDQKHPVLLEQFLKDAIEVDVDAITDGENVLIPGLLEHIETAGVHSGDSACIIPAINLSKTIQQAIQQQIKTLALNLKLKGVFNVQLAVQENQIYILEVNPRASRTLPFLAKATHLPLVKIATECALGKTLKQQGVELATPEPSYFCVKEAVLPFKKFLNAPPILGPEMKSTGEVMGIGFTPQEAYAKAQIAAGNSLPHQGYACIIAEDGAKESFIEELTQLGFQVKTSFEPSENPCTLMIAIDAPAAARFAVDKGICHATTLPAAKMLMASLKHFLTHDYSVHSLQERCSHA